MKKSNPILLFTIILFAACYAPASKLYKSEKTEGVDFTKYKTYSFLHTKDTAYAQTLNKSRVENALAIAVIEQLTNHGMTMDSLNPDCLFTYTLVLNKTYNVGDAPPEMYTPPAANTVNPGQYYNQYYYYQPGPSYYPDTYAGKLQVSTFREGSLVIDMIDTKTHKVIWRTSAQGKVEEQDAKGIKPTIKEVVPPMFKKFPKK